MRYERAFGQCPSGRSRTGGGSTSSPSSAAAAGPLDVADQAADEHGGRQHEQADQGQEHQADTEREPGDDDREPGDAEREIEQQVQRLRPRSTSDQGSEKALHLSRAQR